MRNIVSAAIFRIIQIPLLPFAAGSYVVWVASLVTFSQNKCAMLKRAGVDASRVTFVSADFLEDDWLEKLVDADFQPDRPSFFLWEAMTTYLDREVIESTLWYNVPVRLLQVLANHLTLWGTRENASCRDCCRRYVFIGLFTGSLESARGGQIHVAGVGLGDPLCLAVPSVRY